MYKQFKTDEALEKKGVWLDYGTFRVLVARSGGSNTKFQKILDTLTKPYKRQLEAESLPEAKGAEIMRLAFTRAIILGWEVAVDADGVPIEAEEDLPTDWEERTFKPGLHAPDGSLIAYNEENVVAALKALPDLFIDIRQQSGRAALFREDIREAEAGNSKRS